jgi:cytochrome c5
MSMSQKYPFICTLLLSASFAFLFATLQAQSQAAPQASARPVKKQAANTRSSQQHQDEGSRIFDQNCSRCHAAPEGFSPSISGTVVRHMRVRASLSRHDEEELLRFLNP